MSVVHAGDTLMLVVVSDPNRVTYSWLSSVIIDMLPVTPNKQKKSTVILSPLNDVCVPSHLHSVCCFWDLLSLGPVRVVPSYKKAYSLSLAIICTCHTWMVWHVRYCIIFWYCVCYVCLPCLGASASRAGICVPSEECKARVQQECCSLCIIWFFKGFTSPATWTFCAATVTNTHYVTITLFVWALLHEFLFISSNTFIPYKCEKLWASN